MVSRFSHAVAAWQDVREKAVRLRKNGQVHIILLDDDVIAADVAGDNGYYHVVLYRQFPGSWSITQWECSCKWGDWAFKRQETYVGRFCSHALATLHAAHSEEYLKNPVLAGVFNGEGGHGFTHTDPEMIPLSPSSEGKRRWRQKGDDTIYEEVAATRSVQYVQPSGVAKLDYCDTCQCSEDFHQDGKCERCPDIECGFEKTRKQSSLTPNHIEDFIKNHNNGSPYVYHRVDAYRLGDEDDYYDADEDFDRVDNIRRNGLVPWDSEKGIGHNWQKAITPRKNHVYLFGEAHKVYSPSDAAIRIDLRKLDPRHISADEDLHMQDSNNIQNQRCEDCGHTWHEHNDKGSDGCVAEPERRMEHMFSEDIERHMLGFHDKSSTDLEGKSEEEITKHHDEELHAEGTKPGHFHENDWGEPWCGCKNEAPTSQGEQYDESGKPNIEETFRSLREIRTMSYEHGIPPEAIEINPKWHSYHDYLEDRGQTRLTKTHLPEGVSNRELDIPMSDKMHSVLRDLHSNGQKAFVVGGAVRDAVMGKKPKDVDIEVHNTSYEDLASRLAEHGKVDVVGKQFGVIKFRPHGEDADYDFSLPRRESSTGIGHKDFHTEFDPSITPKEAASRRDFTMNAMMYDPVNKQLHDYFGGEQHIKDKVIRHVSDDSFPDDPLRSMRAFRQSAQHGMDIHPDTKALITKMSPQHSTLPKERIGEEFMKIAHSPEPGRALRAMYETGYSENFPALHSLRGVKQDEEWHPEGDVASHTIHATNAAAKISEREGLSGDNRAAVVLAAMTHDVGKATHTQTDGDRITSHGHDKAGGPIAKDFLDSIDIKPDITDKVVPLVEAHMSHLNFSEDSQPRTIRRLAQRIKPASIKELSHVMEADHSGRPPLEGGMPEGAKHMLRLADESKVTDKPMERLIEGRHVMPYFDNVPGKHIGDTVKEAYEAQMNGEINTPEEADAWLKNRFKDGAPKLAWKSIGIARRRPYYHEAPEEAVEGIETEGIDYRNGPVEGQHPRLYKIHPEQRGYNYFWSVPIHEERTPQQGKSVFEVDLLGYDIEQDRLLGSGSGAYRTKKPVPADRIKRVNYKKVTQLHGETSEWCGVFGEHEKCSGGVLQRSTLIPPQPCRCECHKRSWKSISKVRIAQATGDCYAAAGRWLMKNPDLTGIARLVHGTITKDGNELHHAWVELDDDTVVDPSNGTVSVGRKDEYYDLLNAKVHRSYHPREGLALMARNRHWGPWEDNERTASNDMFDEKYAYFFGGTPAPRQELHIATAEGLVAVNVEIADDPESIKQGLMNRTTLGSNDGMAFVFERETNTSFWMMNTYIPLSIAFWDKTGRIVDIADMDKYRPGRPVASHRPEVPFVGALEVNQGFFEERGVQVGDQITLVVGKETCKTCDGKRYVVTHGGQPDTVHITQDCEDCSPKLAQQLFDTESLTQDDNVSILTKGNSKLGEHVWHTDLPSHDSCPGKSKWCKLKCYVKKYASRPLQGHGSVHQKYKAIHKILRNNPENYEHKLRTEIADKVKSSPIGRVLRFHTSGDFESPEHVKIWHRVAEDHPQIEFYGYTRSHVVPHIAPHLEEFKSLPNVHLRASTDPTMPDPDETKWAQARIFDEEGKTSDELIDSAKKQGYVVCPEQTGQKKDCGACGLCWNNKFDNKRLAFIAHDTLKESPPTTKPIKIKPDNQLELDI